jgi:broad specificity phosphatase PhoE
MKIFFVRHGESEANLLKVFSNRGWKHPLTDKGRLQAIVLARKFAGIPVTALYTSPLSRAVETAKILGRSTGVKPEIETALIEYDVGDYEDRSDEKGWKLYAEVEARWARGEADARMSGGESLNDIKTRFVPYLERLVKDFGNSEAVPVLVGHGGIYRHALPMVLSNVTPGFAREHNLAHTDMVEAEYRDGVLRCVSWAGLPPA